MGPWSAHCLPFYPWSDQSTSACESKVALDRIATLLLVIGLMHDPVRKVCNPRVKPEGRLFRDHALAGLRKSVTCAGDQTGVVGNDCRDRREGGRTIEITWRTGGSSGSKRMNVHCRDWAAVALVIALMLSGEAAWCQSTKTIKIVVPYSPGSGPDILGRL